MLSILSAQRCSFRASRAHARARTVNMNNPRGCLRVLSGSFMRFARSGDIDGLRAYLRSDGFMATFKGLAPPHRHSAMQSYAKAEALREAKSSRRLPKPKPLHAKRADKTFWGDPVMRNKLAEAYRQPGDDDEKAARMLGVTIGAARLAKKRHLMAA